MKRIYDIGANLGKFTEKYLEHFPNCEFVIIEANPKLCENLKAKFSKNSKVTVLNYCLSNSENELIDFYLCEENTISTASINWINNSRFSNYKFDKVIKVESKKLQSIVDSMGVADFTKIDVEGYEKEVIKSLKNHIGLLSFEWAEELKSDMIETVGHLKKIGYENFFISFNDDYLFMPQFFYSYENILEEISNLDSDRKAKWGMIFAK